MAQNNNLVDKCLIAKPNHSHVDLCHHVFEIEIRHIAIFAGFVICAEDGESTLLEGCTSNKGRVVLFSVHHIDANTGALACDVRPIQRTKNTSLVKILQDGQRLRSENILGEGTQSDQSCKDRGFQEHHLQTDEGDSSWSNVIGRRRTLSFYTTQVLTRN